MQSFEDDALIDDTLRLSQEVDHEEMKHHRTKEEISESSESAFEEFEKREAIQRFDVRKRLRLRSKDSVVEKVTEGIEITERC